MGRRKHLPHTQNRYLPAIVTALATTTAGTPIGLRARFIDSKRTAVQFAAAQRFDGAQPFRIAAHLDKSESLGLTCVPIGDDTDAIHRSVLLEQRSDGVFGSIEAQISYENIFHVFGFLLRLQRGKSRQEQTKAVEPDNADRCQKISELPNYTLIVTQNAAAWARA